MKTIQILGCLTLVGILVTGLTSCDEKIILKPETTHIKGDLGDYYEVVDRAYTVTDDWGDMVSIEVMRTDNDFDFNVKGCVAYGTSGAGVEKGERFVEKGNAS